MDDFQIVFLLLVCLQNVGVDKSYILLYTVY